MFLGLTDTNTGFCLIQIPAKLSLTLINPLRIGILRKLLFKRLDLLSRHISRPAGIFNNLLRFPSGLLHGLFAFFFKLRIVFFALLFNLLSFFSQSLSFSSCMFHLLALLFQLRQYIFKVFIAFTNQIRGFFQNIL